MKDFYLLTFLPLATVTTFRNKRSDNDDYGKLPEEELHNLTAAYRGILSNHSHILNRDGVYSQRGDAIEKEMRSIVEECGMILFSRIKSLEARSPNLSTAMKYAPNANEATVRDITWCWTKYVSYSCSVTCVYTKRFLPDSRNSII